jgi:agmatine deiminase
MTNARRFPAEWEKHQAVVLCFPHDGKDWPGKYGAIQWAFVEFIKKAAASEPVILLVASGSHQEKVLNCLQTAHVRTANISFVVHRTNRSWMRDSGPVVVKTRSGREALNFNFNGWAKYANHRLDRQVPATLAGRLQMPLTGVTYQGRPVVLEGGAIDTNGKGTLLTSEECLLDSRQQVRNPGLTREDYEAVFAEYLGIRQVIWLGKGIEGDDTHGHIDDLCRFVDTDTIVTVVENNTRDRNYPALQDNLKRLRKARLANGKQPNIVALPMPARLVFDGIRLPASYANFLILNKSVLVPVFNDPSDRIALNILAECFPDREVTGISAIDLIWGFGTLHCLSQQIPE